MPRLSAGNETPALRQGDNSLDQISTDPVASIGTTSDLYVVDGRASRFNVRAFATGIFSAMGHSPTIGVRDISGQMKFDPDKLEAGSMWIVMKATSLSVQDDISAKDIKEMERLMNEEVLETAKFPGILYEAPSISVTKLGDSLYSAAMSGSLTLHGVARVTPISVRVTMFGSVLRASGEFSINQSDFDIKLVSVAGGALKLKDELKMSFEIVARRQE
jgi:polyisoprenoid-binding protein YceI